jgi:hypothetical protein
MRTPPLAPSSPSPLLGTREAPVLPAVVAVVFSRLRLSGSLRVSKPATSETGVGVERLAP